ncbi:MAG: 18S rRNA (guanine1575-N7)-methyltransferase, partial [Marteilia pararefringens]
MTASRPEESNVEPDVYYNWEVSNEYTKSSRNNHIQCEMTRRALEIVGFDDSEQPNSKLFLDIG